MNLGCPRSIYSGGVCLTSHMRLSRRLGAIAVVAIASFAASFLAIDNASATELEKPMIIQVPASEQGELARTLQSLAITPSSTFSATIHGAAGNLTPGEISTVLHAVPGAVVEPDMQLSLADTQTPATWGIDVLDQSAPTPDNSYSYPSNAGDGVDAYVIDTGLRTGTYSSPGSELFGRVSTGMNFATGLDGTTIDPTYTDDCLTQYGSQKEGGHGTHVAGTIGSSTYGAAKKVTIVPVRVFGCATVSSGQLVANTQASTVIAGLDWAVSRHQSTGRPGVVNLSLGGNCATSESSCSSLLTAVTRTTAAGLTVVAAAGNSGVDACGTAPAAAPSAITVGALDSTRSIPSWSNYGSCVSLFAPGVNITSLNAWYYTSPRRDSNASTTMDGTSMATPHVAGVAALYLGANPAASPEQVKNALTSSSLQGIVSGLTTPRATTPNLLVNTAFLLASEPTLSSPYNLIVSSKSATSTVLSWQQPSVVRNATVSDYSIEVRPALSTTWTTINDGVSTGKTATVSGLAPNTSYLFRVSAISSAPDLTSSPSSTLTVTTPSGKPTAVRNLKLSVRGTTTLTLAWSAPSNPNGGVISDYVVTYRRVGTSKWYTFKDGVSTRRTAKLTGLRRWTSYQVRIYPKTAQGLGSVATITARTR